MKLRTGDLEPPLKITLSATDGVDTTTATAIRIIGQQAGAIIFDRAPTTTTIVGDTTVLTMDWQTTDTDNAGTIAVEVEVMWPDDRPQTFRANGGIRVDPDFDLT